MEVEIWYILIFNVRRRIVWLSYYKVWQCSFAGLLDIFRITKSGKAILLQSVTDCYYKERQVLQSVTDFITKCVRYYKVWLLLQNKTEGNSRIAVIKHEELPWNHDWKPSTVEILILFKGVRTIEKEMHLNLFSDNYK